MLLLQDGQHHSFELRSLTPVRWTAIEDQAIHGKPDAQAPNRPLSKSLQVVSCGTQDGAENTLETSETAL